jgi:DNA mismatch repair protein MutS
VTFLRTVENGPTDRSYGIHVAGLAGVPDPVVERSRDVLEKLRADEAIETKGGSSGATKQVVFDVGSGQLKTRGEEGAESGSDEPPTDDDSGDRLDEETRAVLDELSDVDLTGTSPVELMNRVQAWKERLDD